MMNAFDAVVEVLMWTGLGAGIVVLVIALFMRIADGTWAPTNVMLEDGSSGRVARWFDDNGVGAAVLTLEQERALAGRDSAHVFTKRGETGRIRLTRGSPAVRATALLAIGLLAVGSIAAVVSIVLLFVRG